MSRRVQRTGCTVFAHGARFVAHMVVSDSPIDWNYARWREVLARYTIDGKAQFDPNSAADRAQIEALMRDYRRDGPMVEECPRLLAATANQMIVTDTTWVPSGATRFTWSETRAARRRLVGRISRASA
jgi:hypothetical protein